MAKKKKTISKSKIKKANTKKKKKKKVTVKKKKVKPKKVKKTKLKAKSIDKPIKKASLKNKSKKKDIGISAKNCCLDPGCEQDSLISNYCRKHYIKNWKKIKRKELILKEGKLNKYIEELVTKYPDKYIEVIKQDLINEKAFNKVISDLELDDNIDDFDTEDELLDSLISPMLRNRGTSDDENDSY